MHPPFHITLTERHSPFYTHPCMYLYLRHACMSEWYCYWYWYRIEACSRASSSSSCMS